MVVKRTCSFCAGEIEPGTGTMYIKRDGAVFHFCSSSCRKQQLHLGRVGHRLKWTRAHALRRQTEQSSAAGKLAAEAKGRPGFTGTATKRAVRAPAVAAPSAPAAAAPAPAVAASAAASASTDADSTVAKEPAASSASSAPKKPRAKKPKEPASP
jgi:large subunit ribosomal protein L24e